MIFNNEIASTGFIESDVGLFFRISEISDAKEISANNPAISTSKIRNAIVFEGVLKFTSLSNSEFFGKISGRFMIRSPFVNSSVRLNWARVS